VTQYVKHGDGYIKFPDGTSEGTMNKAMSDMVGEVSPEAIQESSASVFDTPAFSFRDPQPKPSEQTTGEYAQDVLLNAPGSALGAVWDTAEAMTWGLPTTAMGVGELALGAAAKLIPGRQDVEDAPDAVMMDIAESYGSTERFLTTFRDDPFRVYDDMLSSVSAIGAGKKFLAKRGVRKKGLSPEDVKKYKQGKQLSSAALDLDSFALFQKMFGSKTIDKATDFMFDTLPRKAQERLIQSSLEFNETQRDGLTKRMKTKGGTDKKYFDFFLDNKIFGSQGSMLAKVDDLFKANNKKVDSLLQDYMDSIHSPDATRMLDYLIGKKEGTSKSRLRKDELEQIMLLKNSNNVYTPAALQDIRKKFDKYTRREAKSHYGTDPRNVEPIKEAEGVSDIFEDRDFVMRQIEDFGKSKALETGRHDLARIAEINKKVNTSYFARAALDEVIDRGGAKHILNMSDYIVHGGSSAVGYAAGGPVGAIAGMVGGVALRRAIDSPLVKGKLAQALTKLNKSTLRGLADDVGKGGLGAKSKAALTFVMTNLRKDVGPLLTRMELSRKRAEFMEKNLVQEPLSSRTRFPSNK